MREVVIVGGGLTGLAAAYELERLNIPYTMIEVKKRLGGSIVSEERGGFMIDGGPMTVRLDEDWSILPEIGLGDALIPVDDGRAIFSKGTQMLVDTLAAPLTGPKMMRMAVSSLGITEDRFGVCLENGLMLDARSLIVTAPARYTDHMLYSLEPEVGKRLMDYHYDTITRLSVGFRDSDITLPVNLPPDMAFTFCHWTKDAQRVPPGHVLLQIGVRLEFDPDNAQEWIERVLGALGLPPDPVVAAAYFWPEADPLTCHDASHAGDMTAIRSLLPAGTALVGSDYGAATLPERIQQGRQAARDIAAWLGLGSR